MRFLRTECRHDATVWISLVEAHGMEGGEDAGEKACVNGLAIGDSPADAERRMSRALQKLGWLAVSFEDTTRFEERRRDYEVDAELVELASECLKDGVTRFGSFYMWSESDDSPTGND